MVKKNITTYNKEKIEASLSIEVQLDVLKKEIEENLSKHRGLTYGKFVNSITYKESILVLIKAIQMLLKLKDK